MVLQGVQSMANTKSTHYEMTPADEGFAAARADAARTATITKTIEVAPEQLDALEHAITMLGFYNSAAPRNDDEQSDRRAATLLAGILVQLKGC
jgi:hypothetical protein